ncbi:MAG TPA: phosphatase PAP2 family protein [Solirubrobacteraceae bacterium]|nr:phosphatase PAP2 family protein [Solirubrobacteraceae bacterium]
MTASPRETAWRARLLGVFAAELLVVWGLGALLIPLVASADLHAVRDLAAHRTRAATHVAHAFSWLGSGFVVYPVALAACLVLYQRGRRAQAAAVAISTAGAVALYSIDKLLVGRHRPPVHHLELVTGYSFPSGHATQSTALCVALVIALLSGPRRRQIAAAAAGCLLVAGVAFSRVYLGVHYPSDVVAGVLLGGTWAALASSLIPGATR